MSRALAFLAAGMTLLSACRPAAAPARGAPAAAAHRGAQLIRVYGCGSCHAVPGVRGANGRVAPPLDFFAERSFIAGRFPNTAENLARWIENPPALVPETAMPALGLSAAQARDVAAYLDTLH